MVNMRTNIMLKEKVLGILSHKVIIEPHNLHNDLKTLAFYLANDAKSFFVALGVDKLDIRLKRIGVKPFWESLVIRWVHLSLKLGQ